jgi:DNA invertase Pin-like site-specific DNA recombinase
MIIGYARVSTNDQTLDLQLDALKKAGCEQVYSDTASGAKVDRKGLQDALIHLREGDVLVVWRLDRLGRTLKQLIELINDLNARGIGFKSIQENIDTTTSGGKLVFHIFGALAEFEREVIRERTNAGLQAARARGRKGGRTKKLDERGAARLYKLYDSREYRVEEICEMLGIKRATLYRYLGKRSGN